MKALYFDEATKKYTESHREAVEWYRQGHVITILNAETGEIKLQWEI